jgi:DNA-binding SARP family transcriptional activator
VVPATLARGWVLLERGERDEAALLADVAAQIARERRERARLADTLELRAAASASPGAARAALTEAYAIWRDGGAAVDADRLLVALGQLPDASTEDRLAAMLATDRLAAAGVDVGRAAPEPGAVVIRALGQFEIWVGARQVPASAWQSRKARDLLRILVARRGRRVPRSELAELLWPEDDPTRTGHRLSVLLSIVRTAVHPDVVVADQSSVALDLARSRVDVEVFLADVAHGMRLRDRGALAEAHRVLATAVLSYGGEAFSDEPYADWTIPLREEARAAYLRAVRALAELCRATGETELAVSYLQRLLEQDPYDEAGHRCLVEILVAGGQHGQARRAFARYTEAMAAIGVRPPDDVLLST